MAGVALALLVGCAVMAGRGGRWWAAALAAVSVIWLIVNRPMEGEVLWRVSAQHGLTEADLAGLAGLVLAAWLVVFPRVH